MLDISTVLALIGWGVALYMWHLLGVNNPKTWVTKYPPEGVNRGPNADSSYRTARMGGRGHWFTAEQVVDANERAIRNGDPDGLN